jgi:hypothetical protein
MRADNSHHLAAAARRRREQTLARAQQALRELENSGGAVTVAALAAKAGVSRAWVYAEPELRQQIHALRGRTLSAPPAPVERSSDASLRHRLALAHQRIRELTDDNQHLRDQIAQLHGQLRTARLGSPVADSIHDTNGLLTPP